MGPGPSLTGRGGVTKGNASHMNSALHGITSSSSGYDPSQSNIGMLGASNNSAVPHNRYDQRNHLGQRQKASNLFDAQASHALQKQMNSSRFGGFRTADGASQASKNYQGLTAHAKVSMAGEEVMGLMSGAGGLHGDKGYTPGQHYHGPQSP